MESSCAIASVYSDMDWGYSSEVSGVLGLDSGYLNGVGQVNVPSCSTYINVISLLSHFSTFPEMNTFYLFIVFEELTFYQECSIK